MMIAVVSIGSFDTQYSDYHIMRDIILGLLERGHEVNLIQKQYLNIRSSLISILENSFKYIISSLRKRQRLT